MPVLIRRPKAIVFDILGTASKSGFLEKILFPFLKINLENYVNQHWTKREFKILYQKIADQSVEFHKQEPTTPLVVNYELPQAKGSLITFINFVTDNGINSPAVTQLRFKVWFEGYQQSKLRTPIYRDVPDSMKKWFAEGIKFFVFSNTWVEAQKALLKNTNHGDLTNLIQGHYDAEFGSLLEAESWRRLCAEIKEQPGEVLFLTKSPLEGRAAADAGIGVVLVLTHRHNVKAVSHEDRALFPYVRTLDDLAWLEDEANQAAGPSGAGVGAGASEGGPGASATESGYPPTAVSAVTSANMPRSTSQTAKSKVTSTHSQSRAPSQASQSSSPSASGQLAPSRSRPPSGSASTASSKAGPSSSAVSSSKPAASVSASRAGSSVSASKLGSTSAGSKAGSSSRAASTSASKANSASASRAGPSSSAKGSSVSGSRASSTSKTQN